jgi:hypothetical protein
MFLNRVWTSARYDIHEMVEQFDENLGALDVHLTQPQLDTLDKISKLPAQYPEWMIRRQNVDNTGRTFPIVDAK